jgi:hypothetical protein
MQLFQAGDVIRATGLTPNQLREWCGRRGVVYPDQPATGRGRHALYSWQTILCLRVLNELHTRFSVEVGAWVEGISECQALIKDRPYPTLRGLAVVFTDTNSAELVPNANFPTNATALRVPLDPHLQELAATLAVPEMQLPLFAAVALRR